MHFHRLRRGKHHSSHMQEDWSKLGSGAFGVEYLEECDPSICEIREMDLIDKFKALDPIYGYNSNRVSKSAIGGKKRGPKPGIIKDAVIYLRLPKSDKQRVKEFIDGFLSGVDCKNPAIVNLEMELEKVKSDRDNLSKEVDRISKELEISRSKPKISPTWIKPYPFKNEFDQE